MSVSRELRNAIQDWDAEIDAEATKLIKNGIPPWDAIDRAKEIVSRRRNGDYCDKFSAKEKKEHAG